MAPTPCCELKVLTTVRTAVQIESTCHHTRSADLVQKDWPYPASQPSHSKRRSSRSLAPHTSQFVCSRFGSTASSWPSFTGFCTVIWKKQQANVRHVFLNKEKTQPMKEIFYMFAPRDTLGKNILFTCKHNCGFSGQVKCVFKLRTTEAWEKCLRQLEKGPTHHLFHFPTITHPQVNVIEGESIYRTGVCILEIDERGYSTFTGTQTSKWTAWFLPKDINQGGWFFWFQPTLAHSRIQSKQK